MNSYGKTRHVWNTGMLQTPGDDLPRGEAQLPGPNDRRDEPGGGLRLPSAQAARAAVATVAREAAERGLPRAWHAAHLAVHGLLHLLGYDHEDKAQALDMEALETDILATLGYPDPYEGQEPED